MGALKKLSKQSLFTGLSIFGMILLHVNLAFGQNPLIRDQFTADPTARVINGKIYVFPSHDIRCDSTQGRPDWFCMEDYHVFSSANLTEWEDHGMILSQYQVPWADDESYSMWAPDAIEKDGKFYFYFPSKAKNRDLESDAPGVNGSSFKIGVAVADQPEGPYTPESNPIANVNGIDPNVFIDHDGQAYLYWSQHHFFGAKLKPNMKELDSEVFTLKDFPDKGLKEGPFVFEREGTYYMTYPHVANKTERIEYATADNPLGPFEYQGVIMDESPVGCWTNHQSIVQYEGQWLLFYHHNDYSPDFDKNRSIRADSLFFDEKGKIKKVKPTLRGIGVSSASSPIQIDRYSAKSEVGYGISFLDDSNPFAGWKSTFSRDNAWVRYNQVDFDNGQFRKVKFRIKSKDNDGSLEVRLGSEKGELITVVDLKATEDWAELNSDMKASKAGCQDLVVVYRGKKSVEVDWISFQ
ncbi:family 43 glycosylhydrolase [Belliella sp. DSM 111904]|uniref:Family 43 glycosylhydrolase n=1 Tax=Belliella filtrata TaxID=2923435 RepID=A0ABS9V2F9_9BACT|nr:family 43 glycosylhydrolase [Belliella filtrata]MCH7410539.1 family 43 glycosylhydrolase [Belliella filtrata]